MELGKPHELPKTGKNLARGTNCSGGRGDSKKQMPACNRQDRIDHPTGNGADLLRVFCGKEGRLPMNVLHSITSHDEKHTDKDLATQWNSIHWKDVRAHVNRLQTLIAKAVRERNSFPMAAR